MSVYATMHAATTPLQCSSRRGPRGVTWLQHRRPAALHFGGRQTSAARPQAGVQPPPAQVFTIFAWRRESDALGVMAAAGAEVRTARAIVVSGLESTRGRPIGASLAKAFLGSARGLRGGVSILPGVSGGAPVERSPCGSMTRVLRDRQIQPVPDYSELVHSSGEI